jgi:hypothetical protein
MQSIKASLDQAHFEAGSYLGPRYKAGWLTDWADLMHAQLGGIGTSLGNVDAGFNDAPRAIGFSKPMPTPSLPNGRR